MWSHWLVSACLAVGAVSLEASLDSALDQVLAEARGRLAARQELQLTFQRAYPYSFLWRTVTVTPGLRCSQAWLGSLATLDRSENATIEGGDGILVLSGGFMLRNMTFGFDNCELQLEPFGTVGSTKFSGTVGNNSLFLSASLRLKAGVCKASLNRVEVIRADDVVLKTSPDFLDKAKDGILTQLIRFFHQDFIQILNSEIYKYLKPIVESPDFCKGSFQKVMYSGVHH